MASKAPASGKKSFYSLFGQIPWMLSIIAFLLTVEYMDIPLEGSMGYIFITMSVVVLFIEMLKSGDISAMAFLMDLFWAVLAVILATGLMTYLWFVEGREPNFYHWIGFAIILADAILNPFNAYRTAMRNFDVGG